MCRRSLTASKVGRVVWPSTSLTPNAIIAHEHTRDDASSVMHCPKTCIILTEQIFSQSTELEKSMTDIQTNTSTNLVRSTTLHLTRLFSLVSLLLNIQRSKNIANMKGNYWNSSWLLVLVFVWGGEWWWNSPRVGPFALHRIQMADLATEITNKHVRLQ